MAGYGGQDNNQDFYESGYDMDGVQQQQVPSQDQQAGWQQQQVPAPAAMPAQPAQSQWSGAGQQQQQGEYYSPSGYDGQQGYRQQGDAGVTYTQHYSI